MKKTTLITILFFLILLSVTAQESATVIKIDNNGNVGIATENPEKKLDVNGDTIIRGNTEVGTDANSRDLTVNGTITVQSITVNGNTNAYIPAGVIVMWSGGVKTSDIPVGWVLCDGDKRYRNEEGNLIRTPDLKGRFIIGYGHYTGDENKNNGKSYNLNTTGGEKDVKLEKEELPAHSHTAISSEEEHSHKIIGKRQVDGKDTGYEEFTILDDDFSPTSEETEYTEPDKHSHTITIGETGNEKAHNNIPPYYVLAFIIKSKVEVENN